MNRFLPDALATRALPDAEALSLREAPQRARVNERVVQHEICLLEISNRTLRPQIRIARPRTHQRNCRLRWDLGFGIGALGFTLVERVQHLQELGSPQHHRRTLFSPHAPCRV